MLRALNGPIEGPLPGEEAAMAAFRSAGAGGSASRGSRISLRIAAAGLSGSIVLVGGVAAAASGQLRHDISNVFVNHHDHPSTPAPHRTPLTETPTPTPEAPTPSPSATGSHAAIGHHGKSHTGHGGGVGIGESTVPTHPAHPVTSTQPSHRAHPTKKPHPTHPAKPTQAATPTHSPKPSHTPQPSHSPNPGHTPQSTHTPASGAAHSPAPDHTPKSS